jgi:hypothetical protein
VKITPRFQAYRHKKTGGVYRILHLAVMEKDLSGVVVYRPWDSKGTQIYVRPYTEFVDGRFEPVWFDPRTLVWTAEKPQS